MPNRILKESVCISDSIDSLSWFEEVLFYRLIVNCDDFGRFDGRIPVIKNRLFPLKDSLTLKAVKDGINRLASAELVVLYVFEGKPYLYMPTWNDHQNVRAKRSKYPTPDGNANTSECRCNQMQSDVPVIQSESESVSESECGETSCGAKAAGTHTGKFVPPGVEEVRNYCAERGSCVDPQRFVDYYTSNGWMVGKNKMKDWKAALRNWEQKEGTHARYEKKQIPKGASGELGEAELEAIQRTLRMDLGGDWDAGASGD